MFLNTLKLMNLSFPTTSAIKDSEFLEGLEGDQGFINPEARSNLYQSLGLAAATSFRHTLYKDLQTLVHTIIPSLLSVWQIL